jgi:hypothetical protein
LNAALLAVQSSTFVLLDSFFILSAPCPTKMIGDDDAHTHFATMSFYEQGFFFLILNLINFLIINFVM